MRFGKMLLFAPDLAVAKEFYGSLLGVRLTAETATHLTFAVEGGDLLIFKCEESGSAERYSTVARSVFLFEVESLERALEHFHANGVRVLHEIPGENEFSRYAAFVDPFGNVHEIYEPKPAGEGPGS